MKAILQRMLGPDFEVTSAGLADQPEELGLPPNPLMVEAMNPLGYDLIGHVSSTVWAISPAKISFYVCATHDVARTLKRELPKDYPGVVLPPILVPNGRNGGVSDPYEKGREAYEECVALLVSSLPAVVEQIKNLAQ